MQHYLQQLLTDIAEAAHNLSWPYVKKESYDLHEWLSEAEEEERAPARNLVEWTGISSEMLPPNTMLKDEEVWQLLEALKKLLEECNCHFVLQTEVPARFQYEAIRQNFNQEVKVRQWHMGFFSMCKKGTPLKTCALNDYCQCAFFEELFADMIDEDLSPEEERARELEIEIQHLKRKHGDEWMKYYPYHLDKDYDDEFGNPYNYGYDEEEDDDDDWWRK